MRKDMTAIISEGMELNDCVDSAALSQNTTRHQLSYYSRIEWEKAEQLYILGSGGIKHSDGLEKGCYISDDGTYAVVIGATNNQAITILNRCGTRLRTLDMRFMDIEELEVHARLDNLISLRLSPMLKLRKVDGLSLLEKLEALDLSFTAIGSRFDASGLTKLKRLELVGNTQLHYVEWLSRLSELEELDLSGTSVGPEMDLSTFHKLKRVRLVDSNQLQKVYGFGGNPNLEYIDLSCAGIARIPDDIRKLDKLIHLDLSNLMLDDLPDWLPELGLDFTYCDDGINLRGTTVPGVDMELFSQKATEQNFTKYQEMVKKWFASRKKEVAKPLNEIKVVFLGDGEAGKSHTIARLLNDGGFPDNVDGQATPGIVIHDKMYNLEGQQVQVHFWDFGGQEILHSMHRMFLTDRTVYVVLLNAREDNQNERAHYWLHNIKSFAQDAPVLLVLNKIDQNPNASVNEPDLRARAPGLREVVRLSALHDSPAQFNAVFVEALMRQIKQSGVLDTMFPSAWIRLKDKLKHLPDDYINIRKFKALCDGCGVDKESYQSLLHWLADLGNLFYLDSSPKLEDYVILKPNWITNAISMLLFNRVEEGIGGILPHRAIYRILLKDGTPRKRFYAAYPDIQYTHGDVEYILNILREYRFSFSVDSEREFFPMLCPLSAALDIVQYQEDEQVLEFMMEFEYLPMSVLHQLIVERHGELVLESVWRTGARFVQSETGLSAVVVMDDNLLRFFIRHTDPMHRPNTYLTILKANVDRIVEKMKLKPASNRLIYKCEGRKEIFNYEMLKLMKEIGQNSVVSEGLMRLIPIEEILNQAAPAGLADEKKLIDDIARSCQGLRANRLLRNAPEDDRNTYIRDVLRNYGYIVHDQSLVGRSASGKYLGQVDFDVRHSVNSPWTICEALRIQGGSKTHWNTHLKRLLDNYNAQSFPFLILLNYVEVREERFAQVVHSFEQHLRCFDPEPFVYVEGSYQRMNMDATVESQFIQVSKCQYTRDGYTPVVYHIFVQMGE